MAVGARLRIRIGGFRFNSVTPTVVSPSVVRWTISETSTENPGPDTVSYLGPQVPFASLRFADNSLIPAFTQPWVLA